MDWWESQASGRRQVFVLWQDSHAWQSLSHILFWNLQRLDLRGSHGFIRYQKSLIKKSELKRKRRMWDLCLRSHNRCSTYKGTEYQILQDRAGHGLLGLEDIEGFDYRKRSHDWCNRIFKGNKIIKEVPCLLLVLGIPPIYPFSWFLTELNVFACPDRHRGCGVQQWRVFWLDIHGSSRQCEPDCPGASCTAEWLRSPGGVTPAVVQTGLQAHLSGRTRLCLLLSWCWLIDWVFHNEDTKL